MPASLPLRRFGNQDLNRQQARGAGQPRQRRGPAEKVAATQVLVGIERGEELARVLVGELA